MKAIVIGIAEAMLIAIIILAVFLGMIALASDMFSSNQAQELGRFQVYRPYSFDISSLIVQEEDEDAVDAIGLQKYYSGSEPSSSLCEDIKHCIELNLKGDRCEIEPIKLKPGTSFSLESFKNALNSCPQSNVVEDLYEKTQRKMCGFKPLSNYNVISEDSESILQYQPEIHGCYLPDSLGSHNVLGDIDSVNYLYSGRGTEEGYSFENGGNVRIVMTNVSIHNDFSSTCSYSLYVCGQNAIGSGESETPVSIFKRVQNLDRSELYYSNAIVWNGGEETEVDGTLWWWCKTIFTELVQGWLGCSAPEQPLGFNIYGYNPRFYGFDIESSVPEPRLALIDAIDAGMWEWNKMHYDDIDATEYFRSEYWPFISKAYFSFSPITDMSEGNVGYSSGCWDSSFESSDMETRMRLNLDGDVLTESPSLKHRFLFDSYQLDDSLRMVLGIKKIFITEKPYASTGDNVLERVNDALNSDIDSRVIMVMDPVTFCSE